MLLTLMKGKLHRATITEADLDYEGSIKIDSALLKAADILPHERVEVYNVTNGQRFATYAIKGEAGSGVIGTNGAAAHLAKPGDIVIICTYAQMEEQAARNYKPTVILLDEHNRIKDQKAPT